MHLAIDADDAAILPQRDGGVVVKTRRAALEQRSDNHHSVLSRYLAESRRRRTRNRLCQVEQLDIFALAEILSAKKLGQADDVRPSFRRLADVRDGRLKIRVGIRSHPHLHQADFVFASVFHVSKIPLRQFPWVPYATRPTPNGGIGQSLCEIDGHYLLFKNQDCGCNGRCPQAALIANG